MSELSDSFLYQNNRFYGAFTPEQLAFNSNLQEFTQKVGYISSLETGGKLTSIEAYQQIKCMWKEFKVSKKILGIKAQE